MTKFPKTLKGIRHREREDGAVEYTMPRGYSFAGFKVLRLPKQELNRPDGYIPRWEVPGSYWGVPQRGYHRTSAIWWRVGKAGGMRCCSTASERMSGS